MKRYLISSLFAISSLGLIPATMIQAQAAEKSQFTYNVAHHTNLSQQAVHMALAGYHWALKNNKVQRQNVITIVDYSVPSYKERLYVLDLNTGKVMLALHVAHGKSTGLKEAVNFSNDSSSLKSSLGVYLTANTYNGKHGPSLRVHGLEPGINDKAYSRAIVVHGASYVSPEYAAKNSRVGNSWGCFAVDPRQTGKLIELIKGGSVLYAYAPVKHYLATTHIKSHLSA